MDLPLSDVMPDPSQPRKYFNEEKVQSGQNIRYMTAPSIDAPVLSEDEIY